MTNISKYPEILKNPRNLLFSNLTFFDRKKLADKKNINLFVPFYEISLQQDLSSTPGNPCF